MSTRTRRCELRFSESEYAHLAEKAADAGLSVSAFIRHSINHCEIRACPPSDYRQFIRQLRRIGSTIDQILRIAYTKAPLQVPDLKKALADLLELEDRIEKVYFGDDL